jgi:hypothetical protein
MTQYEVVATCLSVVGVLLIPVIALLFRGMIRWVHTENQLAQLVGDVRELIEEKDKVHMEMLGQMRYDREATNTRLRYLEEYFMSHGMRN